MVDYDKPVGTAGTMRIRDTGSAVEFWILCGDPATNIGAYVWSGVVNGVGVGGTTSLPAGFGSRMLGSWSVSTTQTVTFHQNATGTSGLGGAADHSANINRTPPIVPPGAPALTVTGRTPTSAGFSWTRPSGPINIFGLYVARDAGFTNEVFYQQTGATALTASPLIPGTQYFARVRAANDAGAGAWSNVVNFMTTGYVAVSNGTGWTPWVADVSNGSAWVRHAVELSDGSTWKPAG